MPKMFPHRASTLEQIPILRTRIIAELTVHLFRLIRHTRKCAGK